MFAINNFRKIRKWITFMIIIIAHTRYIRVRTIILRWYHIKMADVDGSPSLDKVQWDRRTILSHLHDYGAVFAHYTDAHVKP